MSIEDGRAITADMVAGVLERVTDDHPDLFTPAIISTLLNERTVEAVIDGATPGFVLVEKETNGVYFIPTFSKPQLKVIRTNLSREFNVEIPDTKIIEQRYLFTNLREIPDEKKILFEKGQIQFELSTYAIEPEDNHPHTSSFEDVFGFKASEEDRE